jgi:hypothetical protein
VNLKKYYNKNYSKGTQRNNGMEKKIKQSNVPLIQISKKEM